MFLKLAIIWLLKLAIAEDISKTKVSSIAESCLQFKQFKCNLKFKCIEENTFDFNKCGMPPILNQMHSNIDDLMLCSETKFFIDCMEDTIVKLCPISTRKNKTSPLERKLKPAIDLHKKLFIEKNCSRK
jgi:hypothetical protein